MLITRQSRLVAIAAAGTLAVGAALALAGTANAGTTHRGCEKRSG